MSLEKLRDEGLRWVEANRSKRFSGVTKLLTDLYPDNAHFIYELLQNAEDARNKSVPNSRGASVVRFTLNKDSLEFEHNGEGLFTLDDVERITGIGDSAKRDDPTSIGKFGIGFKAVFAYTNSPEIHSGQFHFRIRDLVVPETEGVKIPGMSDQETRFLLPFNNPKKSPAQAVNEIERGLCALGNNTLLFLSHIHKIEYLLPNGELGTLERIDHEGEHIEIRANHPQGDKAVTHWLRFQKEIEVIADNGECQTCRIAIAYILVEEVSAKNGSSNWKIAAIDHGQVSIYFPAEKETSKLRFHIHAPFASTVARASVRDSKGNQQLRDHLAKLIVESLECIRDQGMLTTGFLAVLPNPADSLLPFYEPIRKAIMQAFKDQPLTPMKQGGHAPASNIYRGPARISDVIDDEALVVFLGDDYEPPMWAANPSQQNQREDRFLDSLGIDKWGWAELTHAINWCNDNEQERIEGLIAKKNDSWLMRFYALLGEASDTQHQYLMPRNLRIVRVDVGGANEHIMPSEAYFPPDEGTAAPLDVRFVKPTVYSAGRSETQKAFATSFLKKVGVRLFDDRAIIELRLADYKTASKKIDKNYYRYLRHFISYWKKNQTSGSLFADIPFLVAVNRAGQLSWFQPKQLCLDSPNFETGLASLGGIHGRFSIWDGYHNELSEPQLNDFVGFLKSIGIMYRLTVDRVGANNNPLSNELWQDYRRPGVKWTNSAINEDFSISNLEKYLATKSVVASRLIWDAVVHADAKAARARFRPNQQYVTRVAESQLICHLKRHAWIPDRSGEFHKPQEMMKDDLRTDFPYDDRNGLLTAIEFGIQAKKRSDEYRARDEVAKEMGFVSAEIAEEVAKLIAQNGITPDEFRSLVAQQRYTSQPEDPVINPPRRRKGVLERKENAPERESVMRERSIQPGMSDVVAQAKAYLRAKYTNLEGQMVCQVCQEEMPFRLPSGDYYFEAVQCVKDLKQHFFENRLALCPTCAAMYQYARSVSDAELKQVILTQPVEQGDLFVKLNILLATKPRSLRFVGTHFFDLQTVLGES